MARIVAAGPVIFSRCYAACACGTKARRGPPAALPGADVWGHAWGDGAHCRLHYPCTAAEPFSNRNHSFRAALELSRIFYTAISFHRRELLRIENYRKPTRMSRSHSRSVKGPPCGAGLAPWYPGASQATAPQGGQKCLDFAWKLLTRAAAVGVPKLLLDGLAAQKRCDAKSDSWRARKRALARHAPTTVAAAVVAALVCGGLAEDGAVGMQNRLTVALVGRVELKARLVRGQLDWGLGLAAPPHTTDLGRCSAGQT